MPQTVTNPQVEAIFNGYPAQLKPKLLDLRALIFEAAAEIPDLETIEETLKWGEPAYLARGGSTIRLGCKNSDSERYYLYFICTTKLVDTFREIYPHKFNFEGNRAISFRPDDAVAVLELKQCIKLALTYRRVKHLPLLGL